MASGSPEQHDPDHERAQSPPTDWFEALADYREAFGDWERAPPSVERTVRPDWKHGIQWEQLSDEEVARTISSRSNPAVEARLNALWDAVGESVATDSRLLELYETTRVCAVHNGGRFEACLTEHPSGMAIWINDAIGDFARTTSLGLGSWAEAMNPELADGAWAQAEPVIRRVLQFEGLSLAHGGELWQPFLIRPPSEYGAVAELSSEWAILFWLGHEFAHLIYRRLSTPAQLVFGETVIAFDPQAPQEQLEVNCDILGLHIATHATSHLDYWSEIVQPQRCLAVTFLAAMHAEKRYFVRPGRHWRRFTYRLTAASTHLQAWRPDDFDPFVIASAYLNDALLAKDASSGRNSLLDLVESCSFVEISESNAGRPEKLKEIWRQDFYTRLWCASTARVMFCTAESFLLGRETSDDEVSLLLDCTELPPYNEGAFSREVYSKVEFVREFLVRRLHTLSPETRRSILDPASDLAFMDWKAQVEAVDDVLVDPRALRVLHEVASDPWPLIRDDTFNP